MKKKSSKKPRDIKLEIVNALGKYVPITRDIGDVAVSNGSRYLARLLKDDDELRKFLGAPRAALEQAQVETKGLDVTMFLELTLYLKAKMKERAKTVGRLGQSAMKKQKEQAAQWKFDHDQWIWTEIESSWVRDRGRSREKNTEEILETKTEFHKDGRGQGPEKRFASEVAALFHPGQPLVTPELLEHIKSLLENDD